MPLNPPEAKVGRNNIAPLAQRYFWRWRRSSAQCPAVIAPDVDSSHYLSLTDVSVIIPVGPTDESWRALLPQLEFLPPGAEICVVFADSAPLPSLMELPTLGATVQLLHAPRGRAKQMNAAVAQTQNRFLWFVHADSRLQALTPQALTRAFQRPPALHYFDLRFSDGPRLMRINEFGVWWRSRVLGMPFGDQALLLARADFLKLGGYDETIPSAEDHALVWRARQHGLPIRATGCAVGTSARRYIDAGWWRTTWRHLRLSFQQARIFSRPSAGKT
jgi:hypothetical protein